VKWGCRKGKWRKGLNSVPDSINHLPAFHYFLGFFKEKKKINNYFKEYKSLNKLSSKI